MNAEIMRKFAKVNLAKMYIRINEENHKSSKSQIDINII